MTDQHIKDDDNRCSCGKLHNGHICWLSRMDMILEIQHLSNCPTVSCSSCGAKANLPHNVCSPGPLVGVAVCVESIL